MSDAVPAVQTSVGNHVSSKPKRPRGKIVVFGTWCKGCGICVEFCPAHVLALDDNDHPVAVHPENCTACHWCDTHCPDMAIVVRKIE
jgi:2-oxoglutarate ferredoxin oxidoreductase subunit delta